MNRMDISSSWNCSPQLFFDLINRKLFDGLEVSIEALAAGTLPYPYWNLRNVRISISSCFVKLPYTTV